MTPIQFMCIDNKVVTVDNDETLKCSPKLLPLISEEGRKKRGILRIIVESSVFLKVVIWAQENEFTPGITPSFIQASDGSVLFTQWERRFFTANCSIIPELIIAAYYLSLNRLYLASKFWIKNLSIIAEPSLGLSAEEIIQIQNQVPVGVRVENVIVEETNQQNRESYSGIVGGGAALSGKVSGGEASSFNALGGAASSGKVGGGEASSGRIGGVAASSGKVGGGEASSGKVGGGATNSIPTASSSTAGRNSNAMTTKLFVKQLKAKSEECDFLKKQLDKLRGEKLNFEKMYRIVSIEKSELEKKLSHENVRAKYEKFCECVICKSFLASPEMLSQHLQNVHSVSTFE